MNEKEQINAIHKAVLEARRKPDPAVEMQNQAHRLAHRNPALQDPEQAKIILKEFGEHAANEWGWGPEQHARVNTAEKAEKYHDTYRRDRYQKELDSADKRVEAQLKRECYGTAPEIRRISGILQEMKCVKVKK